jgi:hypothetical protein
LLLELQTRDLIACWSDASVIERDIGCTTAVESGQNPLVKECCALLPIMFVAEVEKWREPGKGEGERLNPVNTFSGISFVISLHTSDPRSPPSTGGFP